MNFRLCKSGDRAKSQFVIFLCSLLCLFAPLQKLIAYVCCFVLPLGCKSVPEGI
jgi:hypothetical protein